MGDRYFVWRRNDGYVSASANGMPRGWTNKNGPVTFEQLLETDDWPTAKALIQEKRTALDYDYHPIA